MKALKPILILAVIIGGIVFAVKYTGDSKPALPEENSAVVATGDDSATGSKKKSNKDAPRLEERYGFTGQGIGP